MPRHLLISPLLFLAVAGAAGLSGGAQLAEGFEHQERREDDQDQSGIVVSNFLLYNENESDRVAPL